MARTLALLVVVSCVVAAVASVEPRPAPNVVLILIDALRRDHLGAFGYPRKTSPNLDRLADEGVLFTRVSSVSAQTAPSVASLFSGLYPSETGVQFDPADLTFGDGRKRPHLDDSLTLLAESMRSAGYATVGVVSNPWISAENGFAQGFDAFAEIECGGRRPRVKPPCRAEQVFEEAREILASTTHRPFFLYLHLMDVHNPYRKPGITTRMFVSCRGRDRYTNGPVPTLSECDRETMIALYDEGIVRVDRAIAEFLAGLEEVTAPGNTLVVVTADHGDEFGEHGGLGHGTSLYQELVGSFVLLHWPGRLEPTRVRTPTSLVDVRPLIETLARSTSGGPVDASFLQAVVRSRSGDSFLELGPTKGILRENWKLVASEGDVRLFDLHADPGESDDLRDREPERADELAARLQTFLRAAAPPEAPVDVAPMDPERLERLQALGYVAPDD